MLKFCLIACLCLSLAIGENQNNEKRKYLELVKQGLNKYRTTRIVPEYLNISLQHLEIPNFFRENLYVGNTPMHKVPELEDDLLCDLCNIAADVFAAETRSGMTRIQLVSEAVGMCTILNIESERVCHGLVDLNIDIFMYILLNNPDVTSTNICKLILQPKCGTPGSEWTVDIPDGQSPSRPKPSESSTFKILQVSDIHLDPLYTTGKPSTCDEPVCCGADQLDSDDSSVVPCGYWSSYGNDVPEQLVDEMIRFANTLDFDYVYFTGDIISHRVWSTSEENNTAVIKKLMSKFRNGFTVPVYPILGNHEPSPLNVYEFHNNATDEFSTQWLMDLVAEEWVDLIGETGLDTIAKGGYYTVSPRKGFRLVILNNNIAFVYCWWLLESNKDPYDQLDWLVSILEQAERNGESVHILVHIPSGDRQLFAVWSREYNKIINRFANTITAQFNGHIHVDAFQVHFNSSNTDQAINVAWNGASLDPMSYANPSFKIYTIDAATFDVVDIDEWTFNITLANLTPDKSPEWYKLYSFRNAYDISTLQPKDMGELLNKMASNHSWLADYHLHRYKNSDSAVHAGCNANCQKNYICQLSTYISGDTTKCDYFMELFDKN